MDVTFFSRDPFRHPQWRARRVVEMVEHRPRPTIPRRSRDDHAVRAYRRYLLDVKLAGTDLDRQHQVVSALPDVHNAHRLFHACSPRLRHVLEARLLTTEPFDQIAGRLNVTPKTVEYFEQIFFDVRDRLPYRDFIIAEVLGTRADAFDARGEVTERQLAWIYRSFGYFGGAQVLDAVIAEFDAGTKPISTGDVSAWLQQVTRQAIDAGAATNILLVKQNTLNTTQMLKMAAAMKQHDDPEADAQSTQFLNRMKDVLANLKFSMAGKRISELTPEQRYFLTSATEPRASEQIALANGVLPDTLAEKIRHLGYPQDPIVIRAHFRPTPRIEPSLPKCLLEIRQFASDA